MTKFKIYYRLEPNYLIVEAESIDIEDGALIFTSGDVMCHAVAHEAWLAVITLEGDAK